MPEIINIFTTNINKDIFFSLIIPAVVTFSSIIISFVINSHRTSKWKLLKKTYGNFYEIFIGLGFFSCFIFTYVSILIQEIIISIFPKIAFMKNFIWLVLFLLINLLFTYKLSKWKRVRLYILDQKKFKRYLNIICIYAPYFILSIMLIFIIFLSSNKILAVFSNVFSLIYVVIISLGYIKNQKKCVKVYYNFVKIKLTNGDVIDHINPFELHKSGSWYTIYMQDSLIKIQEQYVLEIKYYVKEDNYKIEL